MARQGLDEKDWQLLQALQEKARTPYSELARKVNLSVPTVAERVRRLEDKGVITGYRASIDLTALDRPLRAVVRFQGTGTQMTRIADAIKEMPEVIQAFRMTGDTCFMAIITVASTAHLESFLDSISPYGQTQTSVIVSEPVKNWLVNNMKP